MFVGIPAQTHATPYSARKYSNRAAHAPRRVWALLPKRKTTPPLPSRDTTSNIRSCKLHLIMLVSKRALNASFGGISGQLTTGVITTMHFSGSMAVSSVVTGFAATGTAFSSVGTMAGILVMPPHAAFAACSILAMHAAPAHYICAAGVSFSDSTFAFLFNLFVVVPCGVACCVETNTASALALPRSSLVVVSLFSASIGGFIWVPGRPKLAADSRITG